MPARAGSGQLFRLRLGNVGLCGSCRQYLRQRILDELVEPDIEFRVI
jgi:hypothetical protein